MKLVLQVFGLAIQGPNGPQFIQVIVKSLDRNDQMKLMECIRVYGLDSSSQPQEHQEQAHSNTSIHKRSEVEELLCKVEEMETELEKMQKAYD
jgi:hypothetical protein